MTDALEQELRSALADRAATMPPEALSRLADLDYESGAGRLPRPARLWSLASAGGAIVAAAIVAAVLLLSSGGSLLVPLAYAGWSASPTKPTAAELRPAIRECKPWLRPTSNNEGYPARLVLADKRGRYVVALYAAGPDTEACIADGKRFAGGFGGTGVLDGSPAPGPGLLGLPNVGSGGARGFPGTGKSPLGGLESHVYGLAGRGVSAVTFIFAHHKTVAATVEHGWYFAWWPDPVWNFNNDPTVVQVTTASGSVTSKMPSWDRHAWKCSRTCAFRLRGPSWTTLHHIDSGQ